MRDAYERYKQENEKWTKYVVPLEKYAKGHSMILVDSLYEQRH